MVLSGLAVCFCGWVGRRGSAVIPAGVIHDLSVAVWVFLVQKEAASSCGCGSSGWLRWQGPLEMAWSGLLEHQALELLSTSKDEDSTIYPDSLFHVYPHTKESCWVFFLCLNGVSCVPVHAHFLGPCHLGRVLDSSFLPC